jgi:hypothetical protein
VTPPKTAREFLDRLDSLGDNYLFRGVSDSDFPLLPSALRDHPRAFGKVPATNREQVECEARAALNFYDAAYRQGLTIPNRDQLKDIDETGREKGQWDQWKPHAMTEFLALAQHYDVPTRLLDWTYDAFVAAYFAVCNLCAKSEFVAVWTYDFRAAEKSAPTLYIPPFMPPGPRPVFIPYDLNKNAHAQQGAFTSWQEVRSDDKSTFRQTFDAYLTEIGASTTIEKLTLPRSEVGQLFKLLRRRRINGSTMFPGYYGAARAAQEVAFWRDGRKPHCPDLAVGVPDPQVDALDVDPSLIEK